ncbi:MAG: DUF3486 family protein [Defluviitaleaceae bacterium]|nr:DUF3486 family protein [Defluviitaleaceae bacterium]
MPKNRSHGKIDKLPDTIKKAVENKLLEGYTYQQISDHLKELGHDVHYSSVHRYGKPFLKQFESVRMAKEFAQLLAEDNAERPTTELHEANNALISHLLMEMLVDEAKPAEAKLKTYRAIAKLQTAQVQNERLKITSRKEAGTVRAAMNMLKERVFKEIQDNHPDVVELMVRIADEVTAESGQN